MSKTERMDAIVRSAVLAVVAAALSAPVSLLVGAVVFYARARMGWINPRTGFEPNLFLRHFGLPLSGIVFVVTFAVALWAKQNQSSHGFSRMDTDDSTSMTQRHPSALKAAAISGVFAVGLAAMVSVPVWFIMAFVSRLITGEIHWVTFVLAGAGATAFMVWVFRLAFAYFRRQGVALLPRK